MLKAVLHDLQIKEYIAGVKALGLISRLITCPLWCILEDKDINILDMNTKYLELTTFLTETGMNTDEFMKGINSLFDEYVKKDCIYQGLLQPSDHNDQVEVFLKLILPSINQACCQLFKDHLPGGNYSEM